MARRVRSDAGGRRDGQPDGTAATPERPRLAETVAEQRRQAVAEAIEQAALELFAERPMPDVRAEEVAEHAGVAVRTFYRYFPTKEHVFAGMPRRGAQRVAATIRARPHDETPFEALCAALAEVAGQVGVAEIELWLEAIVRSGAADRIGRMALTVSTEVLAGALAERAGLPDEHLWPQMAATMAAGALTVGTRQWAQEGGKMVDHQLAALAIAGAGISHVPERP